MDFDKIKAEKTRFLEEHRTIVLATSHDDKVTARTVSYATDDLDFCIMSWEHHDKIIQLKRNPNVALARDNISIRGVAEILGKPLDQKCRKAAEIIRTKRPKEFETFCHVPGMIIVRITPTYVKSWMRVDNRFFIEHLDLENRQAYLQKPEEWRM